MRDARPAWMLSQQRKLSRMRTAENGRLPDDYREWWAQIVTIAIREGIETKPEDWTRQLADE